MLAIVQQEVPLVFSQIKFLSALCGIVVFGDYVCSDVFCNVRIRSEERKRLIRAVAVELAAKGLPCLIFPVPAIYIAPPHLKRTLDYEDRLNSFSVFDCDVLSFTLAFVLLLCVLINLKSLKPHLVRARQKFMHRPANIKQLMGKILEMQHGAEKRSLKYALCFPANKISCARKEGNGKNRYFLLLGLPPLFKNYSLCAVF